MKANLTYISIDKQTHSGKDAAAVVADMKSKSFDGQKLSLPAFMRRTAATAYLWTKQPIRSDAPEDFLEDLVSSRILTRVT